MKSQVRPLSDVARNVAREQNRQNMRTTVLKFKAPETIALEPLDAWRPYLEDDTLPCAIRENIPAHQPEIALVAEWFQRVLDLTRDAMLAVNFPCFEHIQLLSCSAVANEERVYNAVISLPEMENYAQRPFNSALVGAISCAYYMQVNPPNKAELEDQFRTIQSRLLDELRKDAVFANINLRVLHTAYLSGIPFWHFGIGVYQLGWGAAAKLVDRSTSRNDSAMSNKLTKFKHVTTKFLRDAGLPVPEHALVTNLERARETATSIGWPVVIKPADLERGEGVHVDVRSEHLEAAFKNAAELSRTNSVLVERQVSGVCHRLFVSGGELLYAVKRLPIGVYGDGIQTIASLVETEGAAQRVKPIWLRSKLPKLDDLGQAAIASAGFEETSIPEKGFFVALRRIETTAWGGVDEDVTDIVHPENLRVALEATKLCGLDVAGVDIITDEISKPWMETGAIINEVNYVPSLGGAEISRQNLHEHMKRLMGGDGRIPVEVFVGDERALDAAIEHARALSGQGTKVYVTSADRTIGPSAQEIPFATTGLRNRVRALTLNSDVEALVIVILSDALLDEGLPIEGIDAVQFFGEPKLSGNDPSMRLEDLKKRLSAWVWPRD